MHSNVTDLLMGIYSSRLDEAILTAANKKVYKISFIADSISFSFNIKQYLIAQTLTVILTHSKYCNQGMENDEKRLVNTHTINRESGTLVAL